MKGKLYGVGVGPGDPELLTIKAVQILGKIDVIAVPESQKEKGSIAYSIVSPYLKKEVELISLTFPMTPNKELRENSRQNNAALIYQAVMSGRKVAFLTLGDPMFYSTFIYLAEHLNQSGIEIESIPGIPAFTASASRLVYPLVKGDESVCVISDFDEARMERITGEFNTFVFMKVSAYSREIGNWIRSNHFESGFFMVSRCGLPDEEITADISDLENGPVDYLSTVIVRKNNVKRSTHPEITALKSGGCLS